MQQTTWLVYGQKEWLHSNVKLLFGGAFDWMASGSSIFRYNKLNSWCPSSCSNWLINKLNSWLIIPCLIQSMPISNKVTNVCWIRTENARFLFYGNILILFWVNIVECDWRCFMIHLKCDSQKALDSININFHCWSWLWNEDVSYCSSQYSNEKKKIQFAKGNWIRAFLWCYWSSIS